MNLIIKKGWGVVKNKLKTKRREITLILVTAMVVMLFFTGYSLGKGISDTIITTKAKIAEPILVVDSNEQVSITGTQNKGYYNFKVKNYDEKNKVTDVDMIYNIEIISNTDESIIYNIYKDNEKIPMTNNKTGNLIMTKDEKQEHNYKLEIVYDKTKSISLSDIVENIQIKVHSEQKKA